MEKRIARLIIDRRGTILLIVGLITLFFLYKASQTEMVTAFKDLLPQNHPYIKLHREFQDTFGGANTISIAVESKKGDIFNIDTLTKVKEMNDLIELTRGVNNYQIHSIARHNVKDIRATSWGIEADPVMHPYVPETREEIEKLKKVIYGNETIYGKLVSRDSKAALILAEFLEERLDYKYLFKRIMEAKNSLEDNNTTIYIAGEPILYGWIYHYFREIVYVMVATTLVMILMLWIYLKRIEGVIIPMTSALLTAIWGLGITRLLGFNFDPLTLVIPFVIAARTLSHSVQMAERFDAEYTRIKDKKLAARAALEGLLPPATISIITDAFGVLIIALAPIPLLQKLGVTGCLWLLTDLVSVLVMAPILYTYFPIPGKIEEGKEKVLTRILRATGAWCLGRTRWAILSCVLVVIIWSGYNLRSLTIGDARPGTPLLWPDSPYNNSVKMINSKFPGTDKLIVVVRGNKPEAIKRPRVLAKMKEFERYLNKHPKVGATNSVTSLAEHLSMCLHYDNPKWRFLPHEYAFTAGYLADLQESGEPGYFDRFCDWFFKDASITVFLKDHHGDTIREIMERSKEFINSNPLTEAKFQLAGGLIGILAAANEVIARTHEFNLCAILLFIYLCCSVAYRSFVGGLFFVASLLIANFFTLATMAKMGVGLNINTVPVVSIGVGLGVDYGLYIVSRIKDEFQKSLDLSDAIITSLSTAGKAVLYTATLITLSLIFWYFSPLRFQAEMGLLLAVVLLMNMLGAMFLLPTIISLVKPAFIVGKIAKKFHE